MFAQVEEIQLPDISFFRTTVYCMQMFMQMHPDLKSDISSRVAMF